MNKVLIIANAKKTKGGITTVLMNWEQMPFWSKWHCRWLETQINASILKKLYYMCTSYIKSLYLIPSYDIIHFHSTPGISNIVQMPIFLLAVIFHKKIIMHLHVGNQLKNYKNDRIFLYTLRKATRTVVLANVWKEFLQQEYPDAHDVYTIYNPAPDIHIDPSINRENIIFYASFLTKNKGYHILLDAFTEITNQYSDWKLVIAGGGEIDQAEETVRERNLKNCIIIKRWLSSEEMNDYYQRAKIYCIPSFQEGFPMASLEAWSHGTPLVTTPVGGLVDVIKDRTNCMVFQFGDKDMLASCLADLIKNQHLQESLSENGHLLVSQYFSKEKINNSIDQLYTDIN